MAKIVETVFVVKISQLVKTHQDSDVQMKLNAEEISKTLEEVTTELISNDCVVEVEQA
jgi:hypothetical protein